MLFRSYLEAPIKDVDVEVKEQRLDQAAVLESWREADRIAMDLASEGMADFQTIVSSGELRQPVAVKRLDQTLTSTTKTVSATTSTTPHTAVLDTTASSSTTTAPTSSVTDPLASTATTTLSTVTDPLASTVDTTLSTSTVTDPLLSTAGTTASTVIDPLLSTIDTTSTSVIDPSTGSTTGLVDSASLLLGF